MLVAASPTVARASQATDGAVGNIFHGHKYHPLGPLRVKIISSLMWIPLWRKLPGTGAASQAPSARPARVPPPRLMRAAPPRRAGLRALALEAGPRVCTIAQRK